MSKTAHCIQCICVLVHNSQKQICSLEYNLFVERIIFLTLWKVFLLACCIQVLFHFSLFCETHQLALWYSDCMKNRRRAPGAGILFVLTLPPSQRLEQATRPPHYADNPCFSLQPFFSWSYTFLHPSLTSDQPPDQKDAHSTLSIVGSAQSLQGWD